jgi:hypothetical protein
MADYVDCPKCGGNRIQKVGYTWWGGALGPWLLTHVKCQDCGCAYNGKSGKDNTAGILIYFVVILAIVITLIVIGAMAGTR